MTELRSSRFSQASNRSGSRSSGEIAPAADQRLLNGVLRAVEIPKDQPGDPVQVIDERGHQDVERVSITLPRQPHQLRLRHRSLAFSLRSPVQAGDHPYWRERGQDGSKNGTGASDESDGAGDRAGWGPMRSPRRYGVGDGVGPVGRGSKRIEATIWSSAARSAADALVGYQASITCRVPSTSTM